MITDILILMDVKIMWCKASHLQQYATGTQMPELLFRLLARNLI